MTDTRITPETAPVGATIVYRVSSTLSPFEATVLEWLEDGSAVKLCHEHNAKKVWDGNVPITGTLLKVREERSATPENAELEILRMVASRAGVLTALLSRCRIYGPADHVRDVADKVDTCLKEYRKIADAFLSSRVAAALEGFGEREARADKLIKAALMEEAESGKGRNAEC